MESFTLDNPPGETLDLGSSIILCAEQTHTLDAGPRWRDYNWASNTGFKSRQRSITIDEAGLYWLQATTDKNCIVQDTFLLETSEDLLRANFLVTSEATVRDTVVVIDISWPVPEMILWTFPPEMELLNDHGNIVHGTFKNAGAFDISLHAFLGGCRDELTKRITVHLTDTPLLEEGRLGHDTFVKEFTLYPNPNKGEFDVIARFTGESPITLTVWNVLTGQKIEHVHERGQSSYLKHIDVRPLSAGAYALRLDYSGGTMHIRFIAR